MSVIKGNHAGSAGSDFYSYKINQSLRFDIASSTNLTRTAGSPSDGKKATWSWWMKKSDVVSDTSTSYRAIFYSGAPNNDGFAIAFMRYGSDHHHELIVKQDNGSSTAHMFLYTNAFYRDVSGWYHFVVSYDSTDSTAADRIKIYVNGTRQTINTSGTNINPSLNHIPSFQVSGKTLRIGEGRTDSDEHIGGYLAEVVFIDGTAYDASNFGETKDGVWVPKSSSGLTFGNNGFYLPFDDSSAIGDDESSNTNDFTANNLSAYDVVPDSPTNNFCTFNPLIYRVASNTTTLSEGNLKSTGSSGYAFGTINIPTSGKWYFETYTVAGTSVGTVGVGDANLLAQSSVADVLYYLSNGTKQVNANNSSYGATWTTDDIIGVACDADNGTVTFYKNNSSQGSLSYDPSDKTVFFGNWGTTGYFVVNFGQDSSFAGEKTAQGNADGNGVGDFYYSPPTGHLALCTKNLPDVTIGPGQSTLASDHFKTLLYTGDDGSSRAVTGVGFSPDWVWFKNRDVAENHNTYDVVRGATAILYPSQTSIEGNRGVYGLRSFDSDGFTLGPGGEVNDTDEKYVAWNWLAGTAFSNSSGSNGANVNSSGQVNTTAGFSIVSWQFTNSVDNLVFHGLSSAPEAMFLKSRTTAYNWDAYFTGLTAANKRLMLNSNSAEIAGFFDTRPTSSVFEYNTSALSNNDNAIAYCFHSVEGYSKIGSYTGNGSADGTFVFTGFKPAWVIIKSLAGYNWVIDDVARAPFNEMNATLFADVDNIEYTGGAYGIDFLSNGFKPRTAYGQYNLSGTYVYLAFASQPFKFANAR